MMYAPSNCLFAAGKEPEYTREAIPKDHISGDEPSTRRPPALLEKALGIPGVMCNGRGGC
jgi:hypothetical protein